MVFRRLESRVNSFGEQAACPVGYRETSFNDNCNYEATQQADHVPPLDSASTLEVGLGA